MLKRWLQFHFGASSHFTITLVHTFTKSTESSTPGSGPMKTINKRGSFQMLCRISLTATPVTPASQNCLHSLHRLMSQVFFLSKRKTGRKNLFSNAKYWFLHLLVTITNRLLAGLNCICEDYSHT